jgi:hypothetical protein
LSKVLPMINLKVNFYMRLLNLFASRLDLIWLCWVLIIGFILQESQGHLKEAEEYTAAQTILAES